MRIHWLQHEVFARCPLCGVEGTKGAVLSTDHTLPRQPPITFLRCPGCGAAFLQDLTPPAYESDMAELLDYYVEQGAGIDLIVAPLLRLPPASIRRCLEIGGSFGFALDFSRYAFGWEVLGVDPSPLARAGAEALDLPVRPAYFSAELDLGPEPFDLAICSEVLEHIAAPHSLLAAIRGRLSPDGLLVLSTPNLALVRPETEAGALGRALSPGLHMVLYDRHALVRVLEEAGFAAVQVEESPETLRAFAAGSKAALERLRPADPAAEREALRGYFAARAASAPPASNLACGFAYRHFKECVNAGLYEAAAASRVLLTQVYRERFGLDLDQPELEDGAPLPFNLAGALFFSGILELNGLGRPARAAEAFAAAIAAGRRLQTDQNPLGVLDGETEALLAQSRKHLPMALAATEPERAVEEIAALEQARPEEGLAAGLLAEARAQTFIRLVNAGALDAAERLAPAVIRQTDLQADGESGTEALDALYCLGMLALHRQRPGEAAERFGRVLRSAGRDSEIFRLARLHEELSRLRAGRKKAPKLFRRPRRSPAVVIAERFVAPIARLSAVVLPLDVAARQPAERRRFLIASEAGTEYRVVTLSNPRLLPQESLRLEFAPFGEAAGTSYVLGVLDLSAETEASIDTDLRAIRAAAAGRSPIVLDCRGEGEGAAPDLLADERTIAAFRVAAAEERPEVRTAYWLDVFWCDPHGLYLRGWVHAHEHRVRAMRIESAGRSARVDRFTDRPDLLPHYPEHEHVRHGGFAVYLACPPGHPVSLTLETDGGPVSLPLPLPEGPLPPWPEAPEESYDTLSPMLRRFVELANARGGRVLQVGSRTPLGLEGMPPRPLLRGPVIGLDIHPGFCVDLVGDAHVLSRFVREGSFDAVVSGSVLEHLQAPWLFAAEVNRVLKVGGLVYHEAPGAWPAHAQPNDFWRMSADGLCSLFGPESGFEVLEARDGGAAMMIPAPQWRERHLDMPTIPAFAMAEILARKVEEIQPGAVAWPLRAGEERARRYPVAGLRVAPEPGGSP